MADDKKTPKTPSELVQSVLENAVLAGRAEAEPDAAKRKEALKEPEKNLKADLAALGKAVKTTNTALTAEDVTELQDKIVKQVREAAKADVSLDAAAIVDGLEDELKTSLESLQERAGKERDPELTLFNIIKAASVAGHEQGLQADPDIALFNPGLQSGEVAERMLSQVEEKLKGDKAELEGDAKAAFEALQAAVDQAVQNAAKAGHERKHFLVDAALDEAELKSLQEKAAALKPALSGAEKDAKRFHVPTEELPRTVDPLPAQEAQEAKDGKKAVEAREEEKPGVYDSRKHLEQARAGGQTMSKGDMLAAGGLVAASALGAAAAMRSGGNSPDPRNPNAPQEKKGSLGKKILVTACAIGAVVGVAAFMRKENPMKTMGSFASMVTGGRLGGGHAAQR